MNLISKLIVFSFLFIGGRNALAGGIRPMGMMNQKNSLKVKQIVTGTNATCAILDNSTMKCWGGNGYGQLGQGHTNNLGDGAGEMGDNLPAINLGTGRTVKQIAMRQSHVCALLDNSSVKCWGYNNAGQLGQGHTNNLGDDASEMGDSLSAINLGTSRTAVAVSVGNFHSCALLDNSTAKCWGNNPSGQLGQGHMNALGDGASEMGDSLPVIDLGASRTVVALEAGGSHTCALLDNSTVKCWGLNSSGQLGQGHANSLGKGASEMGNNLTAISLGASRTAVAIAIGNTHSCALLDNASVKCWGGNTSGQLGQGHTNSLGDASGEMGDSLPVIDLGTNRKAIQITAGLTHTCALLDNSTVKCWGDNTYGQLGQGHVNKLGDGSGEMGDSLPAIDLGTGRTAVAISAGEVQTCAILDDSTLKCWGRGSLGQLGYGNGTNYGDGANEMGDFLLKVKLGSSTSRLTKVLNKNIKQKYKPVSMGAYHTCAIIDNGSVKCWGRNTEGQLGQGHTNSLGDGAGEMGDNLPAINLGTGRTATQISVSYDKHTCALLDNATVKCWGKNSSGQLGQEHANNLGDDAGEMGDSLPAINLGASRTATAIATGEQHSCALLDNSTVKCWGYNFYGQLGQGNSTTKGVGAGEMASLTSINLGTSRTAIAISSGRNHTCALLDNSQVKCWGENTDGELGQGHTNSLGDGAGEMGDSLPEVNLGTGRTAVQISASGNHTCALLDNATVKCWGLNSSGQLGQGHTNSLGDGAGEMGNSLPAISLGTGRTALQIAASGYSTCALLDNSTVKCWGENGGGDLGQGNTTSLGDGASEMGDSLPAISLGTGRTALRVEAGGEQACVILDNSTLKCWGYNGSGQLGQGHQNTLGDGASEMGDNLPIINLGTSR
ncbi:hypothetical protein CIK05_10530 [Bdellovibrio sp. qaytius]|nr:hypothetical protein CIK05_10530 [Bdellovibrio sp. qaytius]